MRSIVAAACLCFVAACGGSDIHGKWLYTNSTGTSALGFVVNDDDTYLLTGIQVTSPTSANTMIETGTLVIDPATLVLTPHELSCRSPDPSYTVGYQLNGSALSLAFSGSAFTLQRVTPTQTDFRDTLGCFSADGGFTPEPLQPVQN